MEINTLKDDTSFDTDKKPHKISQLTPLDSDPYTDPASMSASICSDISTSSTISVTTPRYAVPIFESPPTFTFLTPNSPEILAIDGEDIGDVSFENMMSFERQNAILGTSKNKAEFETTQSDDIWDNLPSTNCFPSHISNMYRPAQPKIGSKPIEPNRLLFGKADSVESNHKAFVNTKNKELNFAQSSVCEAKDDLENVAGEDVNTSESLKTMVPLSPKGLFEVNKSKKYGTGAWSNVYEGILHKTNTKGIVVAVKQPLTPFSIPTLKREAAVLTYIYKYTSTLESNHPPSLIEFHGYEEATSTILLSACPGENLNQFTTRHAAILAQTSSNSTLRIPVVGVRQWIFFAERLIGAFAFLKSCGIVHGDVKPHNILLKEWDIKAKDANDSDWWLSSKDDENQTVLYEPIVSDFSSSYIVKDDGSIADDEEGISAVTTTYCAPELLAAFLTPPVTPTKKLPVSSSSPLPLNLTSSKSDTLTPTTTPRPLPTFSSDLYSLALTLLHIAIGSHPYDQARMDIQKTMWARQGDPLSFARSDERIFRCQKGGIVARLIKGCFGTSSYGRTTIEQMLERVDNMGSEWRVNEEKGNRSWIWDG